MTTTLRSSEINGCEKEGKEHNTRRTFGSSNPGWIQLPGVVTAVALTGCGAYVSSDPACVYGDWTQPAAVTESNAILRNPRIAVTGEASIVVGNNVVAWSDSLVADSVFRAYTASGLDLGAPERGEGRIRLDPVAALSRGEANVVWAEADAQISTGADWLFPNAKTIWTARYTRNLHWSAPEQIYVGSNTIDLRRTGQLVGDERGDFRVVFLDGLNPSKLVVLDLGNELRVDTLAVGVAWDLSVTRTAEGGLLAAYAGLDIDSNRSGVVFFTERRPDGSWREPMQLPIDGPAGEDASDLVIASVGKLISVLWRNGTGIVYVWSIDAGLSWQHGEPFRQANISDLRGAADACGNVHAVFVDWREKGSPTVGYVVVGPRGGWFDRRSLFLDLHSIQPGIALHSDRIVVVASAKEPQDRDGSSFMPLVVERSRARRRR